ncbi:MAG: magnesium/cobalt transporter CorA [Deltaproteobacteria bacterium]|nr:magnesium/cobalt transporter CorA [Deltaproteobacteria bacterium]
MPPAVAKHNTPPPGSAPGTLAIPADAAPTRIHVFEYTTGVLRERDVEDPQDLRMYVKPETTVWVDVQGFRDEDKLWAIAEVFALHPLVLEDATNVPQRAKSEVHAHEHVIVCRVPVLTEGGGVETPQVCIILGRGWLITMQDHRRGFFDPVRAQIRDGIEEIRGHGADYLAYALIDAVVDRYFPVVQQLAEQLEDLEAEVVERASSTQLPRIQQVRRALTVIRRVGWPQREALGELAREPSAFVSDAARVYLRDAEQHIRQIVELADSSRELAGLATEIYLSQVGHRTNEVMKVLTLVSSIFIPLTFIVGIYGMNFDYMPELHAKLGYPVVMLFMGAVAVGLILWFRRRGWWD